MPWVLLGIINQNYNSFTVLLTNLVEYFLFAERRGNLRSRIGFISVQFYSTLKLHGIWSDVHVTIKASRRPSVSHVHDAAVNTAKQRRQRSIADKPDSKKQTLLSRCTMTSSGCRDVKMPTSILVQATQTDDSSPGVFSRRQVYATTIPGLVTGCLLYTSPSPRD